MDEDTFWRIIEASLAECDRGAIDPATSQGGVLQRKLETLMPDDIAEFDRIFRTLHARAYSWDIWDAAVVIEGGCGDDGFIDFRSGLIGLGRRAYYDALADPRTLVSQLPNGGAFSIEELMYAARDAYQTVTGDELEEVEVDGPDQPTGTRWPRDRLHERYPELAREFGER